MRGAGWSRAAQDAAEARCVPYSSLPPLADRDRPSWLLSLSLASMFIAGAGAFVVAFVMAGAVFCTVTNRLSGAGIPLAAHVVMIACAVGFLLSVFFARSPQLLSLTLLLTACALLSGIVLVAHDSAVSRAVESCSLMSTSTDTTINHVWWGLPLLGRAVGRPRSPSRTPSGTP